MDKSTHLSISFQASCWTHLVLFTALLHLPALAVSLKPEVGGVTNSGFVARDGKTLTLNGKEFYVNGWNSYWLMTQAVEARTRARVVDTFKHGAALGMTVCRTWAFNDAGYHALRVAPGVYSQHTFQALDFVIAEAGRHGIKLLLTLVNNLPEYGGKGRYVQWAKDAGLDLNTDSDDQFFSHPTIREYYKDHVKMVLTRVNSITNVEYRNDPTIFGWELINEPRCTDDLSGSALQAWIEEMAAHVKSIDNKHMLTVGTEGFYKHGSKGSFEANPKPHTPPSGTDFIQNHKVAGIDFATAHAYPDSWLPGAAHEEKQQFFDEWVDAHIKDADEILQMPIIFSEFALYDPEHRDNLYMSIYNKLYASSKSRRAGVGAIAWQLLDFRMARVWNDGFAVFPAEDLSTVALMKQQSCRMRALSFMMDTWYHDSCSNSSQLISSRSGDSSLVEY